MKKWILGVTLVLVVFAGLLVWRAGSANPVATVRILDPTGTPLAGTVIKPYAIRGSDQGHYGWGSFGRRANPFSVEPKEVTTGPEGMARIEYPKYLVEGVRSIALTFTADHADHPPLRADVSVGAPLPTGAPVWQRLAHALLVQWSKASSPVQEVQLVPGAIIHASGYLEDSPDTPLTVFAAATTGDGRFSPEYWRWAGPKLITTKIPSSAAYLRLVHRAGTNEFYFSEVQSFTPTPAITNELHLPLRRGVRIRGRLDSSVPRPVTNGWASVRNVFGPGGATPSFPLVWSDYTAIRADGTFEIASIAPGHIEIIALCDGYLSVTPSGSTGLVLPQIFNLTNSAEVEIKMEPAASAVIKVLDPDGQPLANAEVAFWPNERWAQWSATILGTGWHRSGELLGNIESDRYFKHSKSLRDFRVKTGPDGIATVTQLKGGQELFSVEHPQFELPISQENHRSESIHLLAGQTNFMSVKLQKKGTELLE